MFAFDHESLEMLELRSTKATAASQPYRVEPELRSLSVPFDVDVRWLVAVCRVEEKPVRALTMNGRHETSVSLCVSTLGWRHRIALLDGITQTYAWFVSQVEAGVVARA